MNLIIKAALFADHAHKGVPRKYTGEPFINHPMRVAGRVSLIPGVTEIEVSASWLHDVNEDCPAQRVQLLAQFAGTPKVLHYVANLTNRSLAPEHKKKSREERKRIDREFLATCDLWTQVIKLTDRLDNLRDLYTCTERGFRRLYCNESVLLAEALRPKVDYTIASGCDTRIVELERLYHELMAEGQKFF